MVIKNNSHYKNKNQELREKIKQEKNIKRLSRYFKNVEGMKEKESIKVAKAFHQEEKITKYANKKLDEHDQKRIQSDNEYMKKHMQSLI